MSKILRCTTVVSDFDASAPDLKTTEPSCSSFNDDCIANYRSNEMRKDSMNESLKLVPCQLLTLAVYTKTNRGTKLFSFYRLRPRRPDNGMHHDVPRNKMCYYGIVRIDFRPPTKDNVLSETPHFVNFAYL